MESGAKILVIEDNEDVRDNLVEILELYGYELSEAPNGLEGVKQAMETPPDLILCDVMMPELDGYGVLNLLSQNELTAHIPFIFITAKAEKEDLRRGMNLGADDYITKPFYKDELLQVIETRLKKSRHRAIPANNDAVPTKKLVDAERGKQQLNRTFAEKGRLKIYDQGNSIVREGEYPHFVYRVETGRVHLIRSHEYGRDYIIATLGVGEYFGLPVALEKTNFHYSAKAVGTDCTVQLLPVQQLYDLINIDRDVTEVILHIMAGRLMKQGEKIAHQAYDSVRRRTALILCDLHEKFGGETINLSREELAQMVGTTKESVIRAISDFKKDKLLSASGRSIQILQPKALFELLV